MQFYGLMRLASSRASSFGRFARLERILASLCVLIPVLLIAADGGTIRGSISAYYSIQQSQMFYVPLTIAAMLFIANGTICDGRHYNTLLGAMLLGVVLFNHLDWTLIHAAFAIAFFAGNATVIVAYSPREELIFKWAMVAVIALSAIACALGWISLFFAEWISLALISAHYVLESWGIWK